MNLSYIAILNIHGVDYCCIINGISKSEAMALLNIVNLNYKLQDIKNLLSCKKDGLKKL